MKGFFISSIFIIFSFGCSFADLRNETLKQEPIPEDLTDKASSILVSPIDPGLDPLKWRDVRGMELFLIDYWNSGFVRMFTPVPERVQAMKVKLSFFSNTASIRFTDGKGRGKVIGIDNGEPYIIDPKLGKVMNSDNEIRIYVESLRLYILLPFIVNAFNNIAYMDEMEYSGSRYDEIFATNGDWKPSEDFDQYRLYVRKDTGAIEFIRFTYRDVFNSYKGLLHYEEYTNLSGKLFPMKIAIKDDFSDSSFVHQLQIGNVKFLTTEPDFDD
ncbi:MAG: hypothetical protein JJT78_01545 [Leptospira sp.]|nr:hypothetical protein [Leptospira sp.]